jgi:PKHD-type hydroxylase
MTMYKFNKFEKNENTPDGGAYHRHTDAPWMGDVRTDFTLVLALSDPKTYEGGDHHVVDPHHGEIVFRPEAGELMIYETRYEHWVDPVTDGSRICALAWMESSVMGKDKRAILKKCREISSALEQEMLKEGTPAEYRKWFVDVGVVHSALMRMWAQR